MLTQTYSVDMIPSGVPLTLHVTQYDAGLTQFVFTPYASNGVLDLSTATTANIEATKPDGYAVVHPCTLGADMSATYVLQEQLAAVEGLVYSKLVYRDATGKALASKAIVWRVATAGISESAVVSDSDIPLLEEAIEAGSAAVGAATTAQNAATTATNAVNQIDSIVSAEVAEQVAQMQVIEGQTVIDATLTVAGAAADAKATGDEISQLKNDLGESSRNINTASVGRYITNNSTGVVATGNEKSFGMSDKVACLPNTQYTATFYSVTSSTPTAYITYYDGIGDFISKESGKTSAFAKSFTTPANCYFVHVYIYQSNGITISANSTIQIETGPVSTEYITPLVPKGYSELQNNIILTNELETEVDAIDERLTHTAEGNYIEYNKTPMRYKHGIFAVDITKLEQGSIANSTGNLIDSDYVVRSSELITLPESIVWFGNTAQHVFRFYKYDTNGTFIERILNTTDISGKLTGIDTTKRYRILYGTLDNVTVVTPSDVYNSGFRIFDASDVYYPDYIDRTIKTLGQVDFNNIMSTPPAFTVISSNKLLVAFPSDHEGTNPLLVMYTYTDGIENGTLQNRKEVLHSWGHVNSISYNKFNGCLIFGNGGSGDYNNGTEENPGSGAIYIIPNFETWFEQAETGLTYSLSDAGAIVIDCPHSNAEFADDSKFNVVWGEDLPYGANVQARVCYLLTGKYGTQYRINKIRRLLLGTGTNAFEYGTYVAAGSGQFNGTFKILNSYDVPDVAIRYDYVNDMAYHNGFIYACVGESPMRVWKFILDDTLGYAWHEESIEHAYNDDGTELTKWVTGIDFYKYWMLLGVSADGGIIGVIN